MSHVPISPDRLALREYLRDPPPEAMVAIRDQLDAIGFCEVPQALIPEGFQQLRAEAVAQLDTAVHSRNQAGLAYEAYIADLGPKASSYTTCPPTLRFLQLVFGRTYVLDQSKSCYTYYVEGCYLAPHRDVIAGDKAISVLTYLWAEGNRDNAATGLRLDIFSGKPGEPGVLATSIPTREGSLIMGYGTDIWHGRPRLGASEKVIVINGSYSVG